NVQNRRESHKEAASKALRVQPDTSADARVASVRQSSCVHIRPPRHGFGPTTGHADCDWWVDPEIRSGIRTAQIPPPAASGARSCAPDDQGPSPAPGQRRHCAPDRASDQALAAANLLRCSHHRGKCTPHSRTSPVFDSIHAADVTAARSFGSVLVALVDTRTYIAIFIVVLLQKPKG